MRRIADLAELPPSPQLAVIINCGTKWITTLALASTRAATAGPILVIDCESRDGSRDHFERLSARHGLDFFWLEWPLRRHGVALDALFAEAQAEQVLLVDSDVELRDPAVIAKLTTALDGDASAYGAGFLHGPEWLGGAHGLPEQVGYYAQRMWIPLVLLRTAAVRAAQAAGTSFAQRRRFVEFRGWPRLSKLLAARYWIPGLRSLRRPPKEQGYAAEASPVFIDYDTGADLHDRLQRLGDRLACLPDADWQEVRHYHGVTRAQRRWSRRKIAQRLGLVAAANDTEQDAILHEVRERLAVRFGIGALD